MQHLRRIVFSLMEQEMTMVYNTLLAIVHPLCSTYNSMLALLASVYTCLLNTLKSVYQLPSQLVLLRQRVSNSLSTNLCFGCNRCESLHKELKSANEERENLQMMTQLMHSAMKSAYAIGSLVLLVLTTLSCFYSNWADALFIATCFVVNMLATRTIMRLLVGGIVTTTVEALVPWFACGATLYSLLLATVK